MKKLVKNAIAAAIVFAANMMNVNAFANNIDTLEKGDGYEVSISPDGEDAVEENAAVVENWMFENIFSDNTEEAAELEAWMTDVIFETSEEAVNVEAWMTESIYTGAEASANVEAWMMEDIYSSEEEEIQLEDWMF